MKTYHVQQIMDYLHCPFFYAFKWERELRGTEQHHLFYERAYLDILKQIASYTLYMVEGKKYPTWFQLKKKWEKMWVGKRDEQKMLKETLYNYNRRNTYRQLETKGIKALMTFHEELSNPGFPIMIQKTLTVPVENRFYIDVPVDYIRQTKDGKIEVIKWESNPFTTFMTNQDFLLTAQAYAFEKTVGREPHRLSIYYFNKGKWTSTHRSSTQKELWIHTVKEIVHQIEEKTRYPRYSERCEECRYKAICLTEGKNLSDRR